jgi:branched-chain amino acid transport system ATP-binding protein
VLQLDDVHTYYGASHVLQGISLTVHAGEIVSLLGRNGAGKTTTIRSVMGYVPPRRGRITLDGASLQSAPPHRIARLGIGLVPQGREIFPTLTVRENLEIAHRGHAWNLERVFALFPRLRALQERRGAHLSGGEQQMVAIARALMTNPRVLLLDEPSEGLAPLIVAEVARVLQTLRGQDSAILLVEQNLGLALKVADRVYIMSKGRIVHACTTVELAANRQVQRELLGVTA